MTVASRSVDPSDIAAITAVANRALEADGAPFRMSQGEVRSRVLPSDGDPDRDALLLEEDGAVVAFGVVGFSGMDEGDHARALLYGEVDPPRRGQGHGRQLLAWQLERAQEGVTDRADGRRAYARAYRMAGEDATDRLMRRLGLRVVRWFEDLLRPLDPPLDVQAPSGIRLVDWDSEREEEIRELHNRAFSDHWGSVPLTEARWRELLAEDISRPDLSVLAVDEGGEVVGYCLNIHFSWDEELTGRRDGWIDKLGTRREWRGRGVASALIAESLRRFQEAGFTHAMLGVDRENLTGAAGLYRKLGFEPDNQSVCYERPLE